MTSHRKKGKKITDKIKAAIISVRNLKSVTILILAILLVITNIEVIAQFLGKLNPVLEYKEIIQEYEIRVVELEFDRVRLEDTGNILLSIQDYYFINENFPKTLKFLKDQGYLDQSSRILDPETKQPYFYKKRKEDFVFCVQLTDMLKGVNTQDCFKEGDYSDLELDGDKEVETTENQSTVEENNTQKIEVINGIPYVNVRASATIQSEIISRVDTGGVLEMIGQENGWYQIVLDDGSKGWIHGDYVELW